MKMWPVRCPSLTCRMVVVSGFLGGCGWVERVGGLVEDESVMEAPWS